MPVILAAEKALPNRRLTNSIFFGKCFNQRFLSFMIQVRSGGGLEKLLPLFGGLNIYAAAVLPLTRRGREGKTIAASGRKLLIPMECI